MSARRQVSARSAVREWQTVTVASAFRSRLASGRPTRIERADHDGLGAPRLDSRVGEQLHDALRRAGDEARAPLGEPSGAAGGQPVHVLVGIDRRDHRVLVDLLGQRDLDEDPVDLVVGVQLADQAEELVLRGRGIEAVVDGAHPDLLGALSLVGDVHLGGGVVADQHGGEARHAAGMGVRELLDLTGDPRCGPRPQPPCRRYPRGQPAIQPFEAARSQPSACARSRLRRTGRPARCPDSTPITTPSPKLAWTTSSPTAKSSGVACG